MNIGEFITTFSQTVGLQESLEKILWDTVNRAIDLIYEDDDQYNDIFAEELKIVKSAEELKELVENHEEYYRIFMSALLIILEEKTRHLDFSPEQSSIVNKLLDEIDVFSSEV